MALCNAGAVLYSAHRYTVQMTAHRHALARSLEEMAQILAERVDKSARMLLRIAPQAAETGGELGAIRDLINNHVTKAGGDLRIAWTDHHNLLRVGTVIGIFKDEANAQGADKPISLSHREYIRTATTHPGRIVTGAILPHAVTGRSVFAVAVGVADAKGRYLGCLASIIDVENLREVLTRSLRETGFGAEIRMPDGAPLFRSGNATAVYETISRTTPEGFALSVILPTEMQRLVAAELLRTLLFTLLWTNAALLIVYAVYSRLFIVPFERISTHLDGIPDAALALDPAAAPRHERVTQKALAMGGLLQAHLTAKEQAAQTLGRLQETASRAQSMHHEQVIFLSGISTETERAFRILSRYADYVEGNIAEDYAHDEEVFLENVKDVTLNLKYIANACYQIAVYKTGKTAAPIGSVDVGDCMRQTLFLLDAMFEWRCIRIEQGEMAARIRHCETLVKHMVWGVSYLAYRFIDDDARLTVSLAGTETGCLLRLEASRFHRQALPQAERDIAELLPSRKKEWGKTLAQQLSAHINAVIVGYFAERFNGHFTTEITEEPGMPGFILRLELSHMGE